MTGKYNTSHYLHDIQPNPTDPNPYNVLPCCRLPRPNTTARDITEVEPHKYQTLPELDRTPHWKTWAAQSYTSQSIARSGLHNTALNSAVPSPIITRQTNTIAQPRQYSTSHHHTKPAQYSPPRDDTSPDTLHH